MDALTHKRASSRGRWLADRDTGVICGSVRVAKHILGFNSTRFVQKNISLTSKACDVGGQYSCNDIWKRMLCVSCLGMHCVLNSLGSTIGSCLLEYSSCHPSSGCAHNRTPLPIPEDDLLLLARLIHERSGDSSPKCRTFLDSTSQVS